MDQISDLQGSGECLRFEAAPARKHSRSDAPSGHLGTPPVASCAASIQWRSTEKPAKLPISQLKYNQQKTCWKAQKRKSFSKQHPLEVGHIGSEFQKNNHR